MKGVQRCGSVAIVVLAAAIAACSNGGGGVMQGHGSALQSVTRVPVSLGFRVPESAPSITSSGRRISTIPAATESVQVTVSGAGAPATAAVNVDATTCPPSGGAYVCSLSIDAPIGNDTFSALAFSGTNETGTLLASADTSFTIVANQANDVVLALSPVTSPSPSPSPSPAASPGGAFTSVALSVGSPALVAGTSATVPITVTALANGSPVTGTYAFPIVISDSDTSGATGLAVAGGQPSTTTTVSSSSQSVTLDYSGLAIAPFTISVSARDASNSPLPASSPALVSPQLTAPSVVPVNGSALEVPSGGTQTFTVSEPGWLGAPYNQSISVSLTSCSNVTLTPPSLNSATFSLTSSNFGPVQYCGLSVIGGPSFMNYTVDLEAGSSPAPSPSPFPSP
jgi:hypothetical protein